MKIRLKLASLVLLLFVLTNCIKENECCCEGVSKCAPSFFMHKAPTFTSRGFVIT